MPSHKYGRARRFSTPIGTSFSSSRSSRTSFAVVLHNQTGRIMRRYKYCVGGGITVPPEIVGVPKDLNNKNAPGTVLVTTDNKEDYSDEDDDLEFLRMGPKAKLVYHWNDDDGTYNVNIQYNETDGFKADLSGPDARKFTIKISQTGALNIPVDNQGPPSKPNKDHRRTRSFGKGPSLNRLAEKFNRTLGFASSAAVAFLSVTVEKTSAEELRRQEDEEDEDIVLQKAVAAYRISQNSSANSSVNSSPQPSPTAFAYPAAYQ
ncbi:hypothetical protein TWF694_010061 [Orbilia ellipsospora]|uniref:Uncharacterized protein n=1 Tax=Orbilia ellipsospora TaxID=2528407 RepID=A0AAV9X8R8_9PEZI